MTLPNFLIIGVSKCGTTALYQALRQHPQIYMSPQKELRYFAFCGEKPDFLGPYNRYAQQRTLYKLEEYEGQFADAGDALVRGEASPIYLSCYRTRQTAQNIRRAIPDVRMVALLRQPADRIWSAFCHARRVDFEPCTTLEEALADEQRRVAANWQNPLCYRSNSSYDVTLMPYLEIFNPDQLRVFLFDEWNNEPARVLREIFSFLEVDESFVPEMKARHNVGWIPRSYALERLFNELRFHMSPKIYRRTIGRLARFNRTQVDRIQEIFSPELRSKLTQELTPNVHRLEKILDRDLSHWLKI